MGLNWLQEDFEVKHLGVYEEGDEVTELLSLSRVAIRSPSDVRI